MNPSLHVLVTGGPGSGCTTTGKALAEQLGIPQIDSDKFFHKPTDPPFQEQYSAEERCQLLHQTLAKNDSWLLSGSICAWDISDISFSHGILLNVGKRVRMNRLNIRERERFGNRIDSGGDMFDEHIGFMQWAKNYESGARAGRSLPLEQEFMNEHCARNFAVVEEQQLSGLIETLVSFLQAR